jgi:hypothetical protein
MYFLLFEANGRLFRHGLIPLWFDKEYVAEMLSKHEQLFLAD